MGTTLYGQYLDTVSNIGVYKLIFAVREFRVLTRYPLKLPFQHLIIGNESKGDDILK